MQLLGVGFRVQGSGLKIKELRLRVSAVFGVGGLRDGEWPSQVFGTPLSCMCLAPLLCVGAVPLTMVAVALRREVPLTMGLGLCLDAQLEALKGKTVLEDCPVIYHLDVAAMYPNIMLTNRLQVRCYLFPRAPAPDRVRGYGLLPLLAMGSIPRTHSPGEDGAASKYAALA